MEEIIIKYLNQIATEGEMKQLLDWMEESEENQKHFAAMSDVWFASEASLSSLEGKSVQAFSAFKKEALLFETHKKKVQLNRYSVKVAASIAVLVVCSWLSFFVGQKSSSDSPQLVSVIMNQAIMGPGYKGVVTLPDGTLAWLNSNSKLIYPAEFDGKMRKVQLEGEGYFEVKPNKDVPFFVETSDMIVKVLGTHFDVQNYVYKTFSETVLLSGKVEVQIKKSGESQILSPNEKLSFNKETNGYTVDKVDAAEYTLWTADKLVFEDEQLSVILEKMKRWYGVDITCRQGVPLNSRYSMTIRNESLGEILKILSMLVRIDYTIEDDAVIIYKQYY